MKKNRILDVNQGGGDAFLEDDEIYCLNRDITAPAHLVMVLVDVRCGSGNTKHFNRPIRLTLGLFSVHFGHINDQSVIPR